MGRSLEKGVLPVLKRALLGCASAAVISEEQVKSTRAHYFFLCLRTLKPVKHTLSHWDILKNVPTSPLCFYKSCRVLFPFIKVLLSMCCEWRC